MAAAHDFFGYRRQESFPPTAEMGAAALVPNSDLDGQIFDIYVDREFMGRYSFPNAVADDVRTHAGAVLTSHAVEQAAIEDRRVVPFERRAQSAPEEIPSSEPIIRPATRADVNALARIELGAYPDVYGESPTAEMVADVTAKYQERVDLLADGGFIRVVESPKDGPYGMIVCCPTNFEPEAFLLSNGQARDMTENSNIHEVFDPNGKYGYIVNLAVLPGHGKQNGPRLMADAIQMGIEHGVEQVYFESRLPDFSEWSDKQRSLAIEAGSPIPDTEEATHVLAEQYWQLVGRNGQPVDRLLAYYMRSLRAFDAEPLGLIREAWKPDHSSAGYGVLCRIKLPHSQERPSQDTDNEAGPEVEGSRVELVASGHDSDAVVDLEGAPQKGFLRGAIERARHHKLSLALLGGAAVAAYLLHDNGAEVQRVVEYAKHHGTGWSAAYGASLSLYGATLIGLSSAAIVNGAERLAQKVPVLRDHIPDRVWEGIHNMSGWVIDKCYKPNAYLGLMAAGFFVGMVATAIPAGTERTVGFGLAALDAFSTVASRVAIARIWLANRRQPSHR